MNTKLEISQIELTELNKEDWKLTFLSQHYITRIIQLANELGLQGNKIKEIVRIDSLFNNSFFIDFIIDKKEREKNETK